MTARDVARLIRVTTGTLTHWRSRKHGPNFCRMSDNIVRYRKQDIEKWVDANMIECDPNVRPKTEWKKITI